MKAWLVRPKNEFYAEVIFAETRNKAKAKAQWCDGFECTEYIDIEAYRMPQADCKYTGQFGLDFNNPEDRLFLVKECGFTCGEYVDYSDCEDCSANEVCEQYKDYLKWKNEIEGDVNETDS